MAYLSRTDGRRNHAVEYPFSAEIKVCLTASANAGELPRVEAYVRAPDAEKGGNGKRIEESIKRSRVIQVRDPDSLHPCRHKTANSVFQMHRLEFK